MDMLRHRQRCTVTVSIHFFMALFKSRKFVYKQNIKTFSLEIKSKQKYHILNNSNKNRDYLQTNVGDVSFDNQNRLICHCVWCI